MDHDEIRRRANALIGRVANHDAVQAIGLTGAGDVVILDAVPRNHDSHALLRTPAGWIPLVIIHEPQVSDGSPWFRR